jgi:curved DNA-binding protein CbpA
MAVAWRSGSQQGVSRLGTVAIGGLFLKTPNPPQTGSALELLFDVAAGAQVRARAIVRSAIAGKGMGVKFVHMATEDRSRLNQFLKAQMEAGNVQEDAFATAADADAENPASQHSAEPFANGFGGADSESPKVSTDDRVATGGSPSSGEATGPGAAMNATTPETSASSPENVRPRETKNAACDEVTAEELARYLALAEKSNHYQLLGVPSDAGGGDIKKGFYALARKFHPDRHMNRPEWVKPLQQLMGAITVAHNVLSDEKARGAYDRKLIHRQTEAEETLEECEKLAANALRDKNAEGAIFWMRKCVTFAPEVAKYRFALASNLALLPHHHREAVEHFEKGAQLDPWNTAGFLQFGELYELMKLPWRAANLYSKILEFDPGHLVARQRLARAQGKEKKKSRPVVARLFSKKD